MIRPLLAVGLGTLAGLALAILDSSPGYDSTGITAVGLASAAFAVVLIDGSGRVLRIGLLACLVGIWVPLVEIAAAGTYAPLAALIFAAAGAIAGWLLVRGLRTRDA